MIWALAIPHRGQTTAPVVRFVILLFLNGLDVRLGSKDSGLPLIQMAIAPGCMIGRVGRRKIEAIHGVSKIACP